MKTNCELPMCMYRSNMKLNDYDFVLFHLYSTNKKYRNYYKRMRKEHPERMMIFDNSAYEFYMRGGKLDLNLFKKSIEELKPDHYILPDVLMNTYDTLKYTEEFLKNYYPECDSEPIAVVQGNSVNDMLSILCVYKESNIQNICIPFHNSFFKEYVPQELVLKEFMDYYNIKNPEDVTDDIKYAAGRVSFMLDHYFVLRDFKYVHILGSHCPFEKKFYGFFDSMDTGYPVKLGYTCQKLGEEKEKPDVIIDNFIDQDLGEIQKKIIKKNIETFKKY